MKIANRDARSMVEQRRPFEGSNLFAIEKDGMYIVYSYGEHYPMFIHAEGAWFENEDSYSVSTKRHMSQARPTSDTFLLSTEWMKKLAAFGFRGIAEQRISGGVR